MDSQPLAKPERTHVPPLLLWLRSSQARPTREARLLLHWGPLGPGGDLLPLTLQAAGTTSQEGECWGLYHQSPWSPCPGRVLEGVRGDLTYG